ncbi:MAG: flavin monoamine oxidase family protein [Gammaproteobacteria bacterium]|nr:flavin monoamine oxidase family protein [Gammaproteobacteria bacterium]MDH5344832.1 flavin monoamine oxidase family protein [Gammaproteobacteria bacterium]
MAKGSPEQPRSVSKREFLGAFAAIGGVSAVMSALDGLGMGIASAAEAPPDLMGRSEGTRVLILGAGLAGMTAAYELRLRGYDCQILEARPFAGGRCQSSRAGFRTTTVDGETRTCDFDEGQYFNHGPWRLPSFHYAVFHYIRKFGVPMEIMVQDNDLGYVQFDDADGPLAGRRVRQREIKADMRGYTAELLAKLADQGALDKDLTNQDKERLVDYLVRQGFLDARDLSYKGTVHRGITNFDAMSLGRPETASEALAFKDILQSGLGNTFQGVSTIDHPTTMYQPVGGMDQIARAFEREVGSIITYNAEVQELKQDDNGVSVPYRDTATGEVSVARADYCMTTIPLGLLSRLPTDLSDRCKEAMAAPGKMTVGKLGLQMNRRFWEEDDDIYGGASTLGIPGHTVVYPSYGYFGKKGIVMSAYPIGRPAVAFSELSLAEQVEQAVELSERIHPGQFRKHYDGKAFSISWQRTRYSEAGWSTWSPPDRQKHLPVLREPQGRVYFAGDYLSGLAGWQVGAIESAWTQIEKLHASAMQT